MAQRRFYYKLQEAQDLKDSFTSWINAIAHMGNGQMGILNEIIIKPKKTLFRQPQELKRYYVEFAFNNGKVIDASHFLVCNGLRSACSVPKTQLTIVYKSNEVRL